MAGELAVAGRAPLRHNAYKVPLMRNLVRRAVRGGPMAGNDVVEACMLRVVRAAFVSFVARLAALTSAGCEAPHAPVAQAQTVTTRWHALGTWSGRGNRQTESFDVTTGSVAPRVDVAHRWSPLTRAGCG